MPDIVLHHLEQSRSFRVLWLLEELGLDYEIVHHKRDPKTMRAGPSLKAVHPLGRSPVVVQGPMVLAESGAILEDLVDQTGRLGPPSPEYRPQYRFWMHYAEGSAMPPLLVRLITSKLRRAPVPFFLKPVVRNIAGQIDGNYTRPELQNHFGFINQHLADQAFFLGEAFSAVDIQMGYPVEAFVERGGIEGMAHLERWLSRVRSRPAYQRAIERGGSSPIPS